MTKTMQNTGPHPCDGCQLDGEGCTGCRNFASAAPATAAVLQSLEIQQAKADAELCHGCPMPKEKCPNLSQLTPRHPAVCLSEEA